MNKQTKKIILIVISVILCVFIIFVGWVCYEFARAFTEREKAMQLPPYGSPAREAYNKIWERVNKEGDQINKAFAYEKEGKFDLAILEYKKALEMVNGGGYEGIIHGGLSNCYEKLGQYDLAIKEIDWLINAQVAGTPELLERKVCLQKLLQK